MHLFLSFLLRCSNLFTKYAIIYTLNQIVIQSLSKHFKSAFPSFSSIFHHIKSDRAVNNFNYVLRQQDYRRLANLRTAKKKKIQNVSPVWRLSTVDLASLLIWFESIKQSLK